MKTISNRMIRPLFAAVLSAIFLPGFISPSLAQKPAAKAGFIRLVNALAPGEGPLQLSVDGKSVNEEGYTIGDITGGIGLPPGSHEVKFKREGAEEGSTKVNITSNETTILIPFGERIPATDEKPAHWAIRILRLKQKEIEKARSATFVSVSRQPEIPVEIKEPDGKFTKVSVKRFSTTQAAINYPEGYVPIKTEEGNLEAIPVGTEGNYVVVIYDDENFKLKSVNFKDLKYLSAD